MTNGNRTWWRWLGVVALLCALAGVAFARPGGGESFGGGGGGGGGGGIGDSIDAVFFVIELVYYIVYFIVCFPYVSVPLIVVLAIIVVVANRSSASNRGDWDHKTASADGAAKHVVASPREKLDALRARDPDFSRPVFEDFAFRLFATAQRARADATALAAVSPYVAESVRTALAQRAPGEAVQQVVVGSLGIAKVTMGDQRVRITVSIEANVDTAAHTYFSVERWTFGRAASAHSKPPGRAHTFPCPNCGAPWQEKAMGTQVCASCGQAVDNGRFDWIVERVVVASIVTHPPTVTGDTPEVGTDDPTVIDDGLAEQTAALAAADPEATEANLVARLGAIYDALNAAWAKNELEPARPFVSDALYDYLQYWIDTYKHQGLRNALENMRVTKTELAKIERDKWYDAVTIRVWGTGLDYVVNSTGGVVRGSKHRERPYSEYWTLIRTAGKTGKPQTQPICNNCGAPLAINMAGECSHCGSHVTSGEFDWVLSKLEQDDVYDG